MLETSVTQNVPSEGEDRWWLLRHTNTSEGMTCNWQYR